MHTKSPKTIRDRRRFNSTTAPSGKARVAVGPETAGSIFPSYVKTWTPGMRETIFKDGAHNRKIGGDVLVGDLRGAYLVTLSLEERATCPTTCAAWRICYGNNMNQARRWKYSRALLKGMRGELARLCAKYPGVLFRLHVLGDFPEPEYIDFWDEMLGKHRNLFCFGFTAHRRGTRGGEMIAALRAKYPGPFAVKSRFAIRHSDSPGEWGSEIVSDVPEARSNAALICPEQMDAIDRNARLTHCGSCAACWQSSCAVQFLEH